MVSVFLGFMCNKINPLKYIIFFIVFLSIIGSIYYYKSNYEKLLITNNNYKEALVISKVNLDLVILNNTKNLENFDKYKKEQLNLLSLLNKKHKEDLKRTKQLQILKEEINNVKEKDNDIVAPVLIDTINSLFKSKDN